MQSKGYEGRRLKRTVDSFMRHHYLPSHRAQPTRKAIEGKASSIMEAEAERARAAQEATERRRRLALDAAMWAENIAAAAEMTRQRALLALSARSIQRPVSSSLLDSGHDLLLTNEKGK